MPVSFSGGLRQRKRLCVCVSFSSTNHPPFIHSAGHKLEKALATFPVPVAGAVALDCGLSTGGFTDCLLQAGAAHVTGVDVGYGQVAEKVRVDPRVTVLERTNMRHATPATFAAAGAPTEYDVATLDVSFISVLKVGKKRLKGGGAVEFFFFFFPSTVQPCLPTLFLSTDPARRVGPAETGCPPRHPGQAPV